MRLAPILALLAALGPSATAAQPRVLVATEATLATRIRGQIADLPVEPIEAPALTGFEEALEAGRARAAPYVVFAVESERALTVHVVEVAPRRMLTREIPADGTDDRSARLEAAALIVRGALRDLSAGGHVGVALPLPPEATVRPALPTSAAEPDGPAVRLEAGWSASVDGHAPIGVQAPSLAGVVAVDRFRVGLRVDVALPYELVDERAALSVLRVRPTASAGVDLIGHPELALTLGIELGAVLWHRATEVRQLGLAPTDARWTASLAIAPTVALAVFPEALEGILGVVVSAGADLLPSAPTFAYAIDGVTVERAALFAVQPWARLALAVRGR